MSERAYVRVVQKMEHYAWTDLDAWWDAMDRLAGRDDTWNPSNACYRPDYAEDVFQAESISIQVGVLEEVSWPTTGAEQVMRTFVLTHTKPANTLPSAEFHEVWQKTIDKYFEALQKHAQQLLSVVDDGLVPEAPSMWRYVWPDDGSETPWYRDRAGLESEWSGAGGARLERCTLGRWEPVEGEA